LLKDQLDALQADDLLKIAYDLRIPKDAIEYFCVFPGSREGLCLTPSGRLSWLRVPMESLARQPSSFSPKHTRRQIHATLSPREGPSGPAPSTPKRPRMHCGLAAAVSPRGGRSGSDSSPSSPSSFPMSRKKEGSPKALFAGTPSPSRRRMVRPNLPPPRSPHMPTLLPTRYPAVTSPSCGENDKGDLGCILPNSGRGCSFSPRQPCSFGGRRLSSMQACGH